jgi:signal transduction histidine kinase
LIQTTVELFRAEASGRNIRLECRTQADAMLDGVRASALRDALSNLLSNALYATPMGGRIMIEAVTEAAYVLLTVVDGGSGVAPEIQERIWEPFFTTKQRGTGLGLSILKKRIDEVGGKVALTAQRDGEGARFELRIPLLRS